MEYGAIAAFVAEYGAAIGAGTAAVGTAATVYGTIEAGKATRAAADYNARQTENAAAYAHDAAVQQAAKIRKAATLESGAADAQLAASGVKVGEGSALEIKQTIAQNSEQDAFNALLGGSRAVTAGGQQAALLRAGGANAVSESYIGSGATILGNTSRIASGWKNTKAT